MDTRDARAVEGGTGWRFRGDFISGVDEIMACSKVEHSRRDRFAAWLDRSGIPWPSLESGRLDLSDTTYREDGASIPSGRSLRELHASPVPNAPCPTLQSVGMAEIGPFCQRSVPVPAKTSQAIRNPFLAQASGYAA